jgi:DNA-binding NarL/FixJ family response regulator
MQSSRTDPDPTGPARRAAAAALPAPILPVGDIAREDETLGSSPRVLRVLLVEDSPLLVQRISELVHAVPMVRLAGVAGSETEALARLESGDIDAVILDLQLHTGSGFGILRALHRRSNGPHVVVFTNFAIGAYRDTAMALGASHFLDKSRDYDRLTAVLGELTRGLGSH